MLRYIELKSGHHDDGPAWIGRVTLSRTGQTVYFDGKALKKARGGGASGGNYYDLATGESYWVSGVKKRRQDRHWAGKGRITVEAAAVEEYLRIVGATTLDHRRFAVSHHIAPTDPASFVPRENRRLRSP